MHHHTINTHTTTHLQQCVVVLLSECTPCVLLQALLVVAAGLFALLAVAVMPPTPAAGGVVLGVLGGVLGVLGARVFHAVHAVLSACTGAVHFAADLQGP